LSVERSTETLFGVPVNLIGDWGHWSVRDQITSEITIDETASIASVAAAIREVSGVFLGFGSGDRKKWAALLQEAPNIEYLVSWTGNNTQYFFDAVCNMHWLKRLCFGRLFAPDISNISKLTELEYLCVPTLSRSRTLEPIAAMKNLRVLELGLSRKISDDFFDCFASNEMHSVVSMSFFLNSGLKIPSIMPFSKVSSLEYLSLFNIRTLDGSLEYLLDLPNLKALTIPKRGWREGEIDTLRDAGIKVLFD